MAETVTTWIAKGLKSSLVGYAAGGLIQAATVVYLTRITGRTFLEYFEHGQEWGQGGLAGALARQLEQNPRTPFLKEVLRQASDRLVGWVQGARGAGRGGTTNSQ